jgi:D-lyxose ketol-isomerase
MILRSEYRTAQQKASSLLAEAGIPVHESEIRKIEVVDFGLGRLAVEGLQVLTMFETDRMAGRILIMTPDQTEPEHWHPPFEQNPGKQEIIRAFWGEVRFYLPGNNTMKEGFLVEGKEAYYTMRNEMALTAGDTLVLEPGTKHWFQAGKRGAVFYSFSTRVMDSVDKFTDPEVVRETFIGD